MSPAASAREEIAPALPGDAARDQLHVKARSLEQLPETEIVLLGQDFGRAP
jgi:hypothetical protein